MTPARGQLGRLGPARALSLDFHDLTVQLRLLTLKELLASGRPPQLVWYVNQIQPREELGRELQHILDLHG